MSTARYLRHLYKFLICILLFTQGCSEDAPTLKSPVDMAPDFSLSLFDGSDFRFSAQQGKAVVINFFASWCVSCGKEAPALEKVAQEYATQPVVFVAIAVDDTEKKAKEFVKKMGLTIPAGLDRTGEIRDAFGLYGMPTTVFIDKTGRVNYFHAGVVSDELLKSEINKLL